MQQKAWADSVFPVREASELAVPSRNYQLGTCAGGPLAPGLPQAAGWGPRDLR